MFPQAKVLGIDVDEELSPSLLEKVSFLGTLLKSFPQGETAMDKLLEMVFGRKRIERITERIGVERLTEAEQELAAFESLTLMEKINGPRGVTAPTSVAVMLDGGRYQRTEQNAEATSEKSTHWYEYKAGLCLELGGRRDGLQAGPEAPDPCPEVPEFLLNLDYVDKLTREIGQKAAAVPGEPAEAIDCGGAPLSSDAPAVPSDASPEGVGIDLEGVKSLADLETQVAAARNAAASSEESDKQVPLSPKVVRREVLATLEKGRHIGLQVAARAWKLGMFQSKFKAFVGDGSGWIWTIFAMFFKPFGFTPILDVIHAVTYLYAAAMAGRAREEGATVYRQWVSWLWQGELSKLIAAVAARQAELGLPEPGESETSPRHIVSKALTYLQNQQDKMRYPEYRKLGLPITSSHMESTIKELNYRLKGTSSHGTPNSPSHPPCHQKLTRELTIKTKKFWSKEGGAAVLQLKSDTLSASDPLAKFWTNRHHTRNGLHNSVGRKKQPKPMAAA